MTTDGTPEKGQNVLRAIRKSLAVLSLRQRVIYFTLVAVKALSSLLDVAGIALIGLLAGLAASNLDPTKPLVILGLALPAVSQETLVLLVVLVLVVFVIKAAVAITFGRAITVFLARVESQKAADVAAHLFSGNLSNLERFSKGEIVWAVMGSTSLAISGLLGSLSIFFSEGVLLVLVAATFLLVDPLASLFVVIYFAIVIGVIQLAIGRALKNAGIDAAEGNMGSVEVVDDTVGAYREITILNRQSFFIEKFHAVRYRLSASLGVMNFLGTMPRYVVETALMLGVVMFVGAQFLTGQLASGLVIVGVFLTGGVRIMASLLPLQNAAASAKTQAEQSSLAHQLLREIQETSGKATDAAVTSPPPSRESSQHTGSGLSVVLKKVDFRYPGSTTLAVKKISFAIEAGQHVAFIGPSGAGKTTLVDLILGLLEPTAGTVQIGSQVLSGRKPLLENLVAYVPQSPGMVSGTIAENVALGTPAEEIDIERVAEALRSAHLSEFVNSLPEGIFTSVGSQGNSLSGGQIQRLGLARALYVKPKLIILDEATSALDAGSEAVISQSLKELGKDVTVIVIAHRLSTVQHSDVVFVVDGGEIVASGSFSHLRKTVPMVAEYVRLMSFGEDNSKTA
jgi:ABC-type multidrug transport system fused ATPase/permease subunit